MTFLCVYFSVYKVAFISILWPALGPHLTGVNGHFKDVVPILTVALTLISTLSAHQRVSSDVKQAADEIQFSALPSLNLYYK